VAGVGAFGLGKISRGTHVVGIGDIVGSGTGSCSSSLSSRSC